jgi:hypothetical protein
VDALTGATALITANGRTFFPIAIAERLTGSERRWVAPTLRHADARLRDRMDGVAFDASPAFQLLPPLRGSMKRSARPAMSNCSQVSAGVTTLGIVGVLLFLTGCQYDPCTLTYATSKPDRKEIIGHWVATDETLRDLAQGRYQKARPVIDVLENGSIQMTDIPDTWRADLGAGAGKLETFVGTWQLDKHQDSWWGLALRRGNWGCGGCLMVLGQESPHKLVLRFGDPDEGRGYEFRKAG